MNQELVQYLLDKLSPGWRERKDRRKSSWHFLKVMLLPGFMLLSFLLFFQLVQFISFNCLNLTIQEKYKVLIFTPLMLPSIGISLVVTNLCLYLIGPARKAFEQEAAGNAKLTFEGSTRTLLVLLLKYLMPIGFGISAVGLVLSNT